MEEERAVFPPGPYLFDVIGARPMVGQTGRLYDVTLKLRGTDAVLHWFVSPKAAWAWQDVVDLFDDVPRLVGCSFIALVAVDLYNGIKRNRIKGLIVEVLDA